jgi:hypothetical protein
MPTIYDDGESAGKCRPTSAPEKLCGFFVTCEPGGLATRPSYSIHYGPFATLEKAVAFKQRVGSGQIAQWDLHLVSRHELTHEEYEREFAHLPHLITLTDQN